MDRLAHALGAARRGRSETGVVFVDLDGFKAVNDTLGHDVGDQLLRQVADRLSAAIRTGDTAARIGGDEFVVLCERIDGLAQVREIADRISEQLKGRFVIGEHEIRISASVGVSLGGGCRRARCSHGPTRRCTGPSTAARGLVEVRP